MRSLSLLALAVAAGPLGCAVSESAGTENTNTGATAVVVVERTVGDASTMASMGTVAKGDAVVAHFLRVRQGAVDEAALRIAGLIQDLPSAGTCAVPGEPSSSSQAREVDLLDIGVVSLDSTPNNKSTVLIPRSMPDPAGFVSGVFYSARSLDTFVPGTRVVLHSAGGTDMLEGFAVSVSTPHDLGEVRVTTTAARGEPGLDVSWDTVDPDPRDIVYIDVLAPSSHVVSRCTATEAGHALVPAAGDEGQLAVHRIHRETFKARGIDTGEIRFDVAKVVAYHR